MNSNEQDVAIKASGVNLSGILHVPQSPKGIVVFAHGSGSGRLSPRNQFVARKLQQHNIATLLLDLLTMDEEKLDDETREFRFDISLLAKRLVGTCDWLLTQPETVQLRIGYFGASTGAAAALVAAAEQKETIHAIVSRGGRPDLALGIIKQVTAPTMLIVGGNDYGVIELNKKAFDAIVAEKKFEIVPHATHLFEESGALEQVANLASSWFTKHF